MKRPPAGAYDIAPDLEGDAMKTFDARTLPRWRAWLAAHHASESEIWLIYHKKHTGRPTVAYLDALDEALCVGWIDSLIKRVDDDRYAIKYTPRKPGSKWSAINRKRYAAVEAAGRLKAAGKARSPRSGGSYGAKPTVPAKLPAYISRAIKPKPSAWAFFRTLTAKQQRYHWGWIHIAKQQDTRERRLREVIRLLSAKQKLGLK
jgi:uncharacterized protein YdeI (YjbR/CyaY-like superfamily)